MLFVHRTSSEERIIISIFVCFFLLMSVNLLYNWCEVHVWLSTQFQEWRLVVCQVRGVCMNCGTDRCFISVWEGGTAPISNTYHVGTTFQWGAVQLERGGRSVGLPCYRGYLLSSKSHEQLSTAFVKSIIKCTMVHCECTNSTLKSTMVHFIMGL